MLKRFGIFLMVKLMLMEVPNDEYGAPWNDMDFERTVTITVKVTIPVSFKGPANISESMIRLAVVQKIKDDLESTIYDDFITEF